MTVSRNDSSVFSPSGMASRSSDAAPRAFSSGPDSRPVSGSDPARPGHRIRLAGNTATGILKIIALVFMFIDHSGKMLFPGVSEMRYLGRIAYPLYVWCMIVGFEYTRSVPTYLLRVVLVGLASQPLYMLALNHTWNQPNIFLTLSLALCGLWGMREKKFFSHLWAPAAAVLLAGVLGADYGWKGVLFVFLLWTVRNTRPGIAAVMIAYFLFWGTYYSITPSLFGFPLRLSSLPEPLSSILTALNRMESYGLLAMPLILIRFKHDWKMPAWLSYGLYPAHLLLLWVLEKIFL